MCMKTYMIFGNTNINSAFMLTRKFCQKRWYLRRKKQNDKNTKFFKKVY